jgi:hypothetical protein
VNFDQDNDIDHLYVAPRDQFVHERDALARALRTAGDRATAAEVAALRKPTLVAWTVNQLAHTNRRDIDLLLDAGQRIIDAQQASISSGGRAELDAALATLRKAVSGLTESAKAILGPEASRTTLARVAETLRTAATAPTGREALARGRLTEDMSETGWEIVAGFTPAPGAKSKRGGKAAADPEKATPHNPAAEIKAQEKRLRELERARSAADRKVRDARLREQHAAERLEELQADRSIADAHLEAIERDIADAERRVSELRDAH